MESFVLAGIIPTGNAYHRREEIGRGAYAKVFQVEYCGCKYAAKEIHSLLLDDTSQEHLQMMKDRFLKIPYLLSKCRHPNIVQFIGIYYPVRDNTGIPITVMELMDFSLTRLVERDRLIPLHSALSILHDVSLGLWYLHSRNPPVMHCNLSPNTILVNSNSRSMVAKIADFGSAVEGNKGDILAPGTPDFMPPEAYVENPIYDLSLDVFSYGGVALFAVVGKWPSPTVTVQFDPKTRRKVVLSEVEQRQQYLDKMTGEDAVLRSLVEECLDDDPAVRPTIEVVSTRIKEIKKICHSETKVILDLM